VSAVGGTPSGAGAGPARYAPEAGSDDARLRWLAVVALSVLTWSYLGVLYGVVAVVGDPPTFFGIVALALVGGVALGRFVRPRVALGATLVILAAGTAYYLGTLSVGFSLLASFELVYRDVLALATGLSVLRIINAGLWATVTAPAPVFLSWYLVSRDRHVWAAAVGLGALLFFVLTGDAGAVTTLLGTVAATVVAGLGEAAARGGSLGDVDAVAVVVAAMVLLTTTVSVVPGGTVASLPLSDDGGTSPGTVETSLTTAGDEVTIAGSLALSPGRRFVVRSDVRGYWRVAAYDRYTGDGWIRTGDEVVDRRLRAPVSSDRTVEQTFVARSTVRVMPALWRPVAVVGRERAVTAFGGLQPTSPLQSGDRYTVRSRIALPTSDELRAAGENYPEGMERFLELPANTPDRLETFTTRLTADAETPYDTARTIEAWLEENKAYSLNVDRPEGTVAAGFLFGMEAGYCTYFATAMVAMLRSQGVPARFAVGYTPGEATASEQYVVRGLDSHAWVEAYFPGHGWVRFDPTPAGPRREAETSALDGTGPTRPSATVSTPTEGNGTTTAADSNGTTTTTTAPTGPGGPAGGDGDGSVLSVPSREQVVFGVIVVAGLAAGARRSGAASRAWRILWLRRQPRGPDPGGDVEGAFARLEYLLGRLRRSRLPGETPREYVRAVADDERIHRVARLHERAAYAGRATAEDADEAVALVDELVVEYGDRLDWLGRIGVGLGRR